MHTREGPSRDRIPENQRPHKDDDQEDERQKTEEHPHERRDGQRYCRKRHNAVDAVQKQFPKGPLGLPRGPLRIFEFDPLGVEAAPSEQALGKTVVFTEFQQGIDILPCEKPVVPGAVHDFGLGQFPDEPVKQTGEEGPGLPALPLRVTLRVATQSYPSSRIPRIISGNRAGGSCKSASMIAT